MIGKRVRMTEAFKSRIRKSTMSDSSPLQHHVATLLGDLGHTDDLAGCVGVVQSVDDAEPDDPVVIVLWPNKRQGYYLRSQLEIVE